MKIHHLIFREIVYRKWNFLLTVLSVVVAIGCLVGELTVLRLHDLSTEQILAAKEIETQARVDKRVDEMEQLMAKLTDDYRKIARELGFNVMILPKKQDLWELQELQYATEIMPEESVKKLANSKIVTVNHLLPMVQKMLTWKEKGRDVLLTGTRGEVPLQHASPKKPIVYPIPPGTLALGHHLHKQLNLKKGDKVTFLGKEYKIQDVHPHRGTIDDITVWMNLEEAQEILDRKGKINLIKALGCNCEIGDPDERVAEILREIKAILPDTQVVEFASIASNRAAQRTRAAKEKEANIAREKEKAAEDMQAATDSRDEIKAQLWSFAALLIPLVLLGCIVWLGLTSLSNVRERQVEIGILRALGLSSAGIYILFISRAVLVGVIGAVVGYSAGAVVGYFAGETAALEASAIFDPILFLVVLFATPAVCALVGWMSALIAARQDPAVILQQA